MDIRKSFLSERVVKHWKMLLREVVELSFLLGGIKRHADVALRDTVSGVLGSVCLMVGVDNFKGLFQPKRFYDSKEEIPKVKTQLPTALTISVQFTSFS